MGNDITAGHEYAETESGRVVNVDNLNRHVSDATIKETFISAKTLKSPPALSDQIVISDGALKKTTLQLLLTLFQPDGFLTADTAGRAKMADEYVTAAKLAATLDLSSKALTLPATVISDLSAVTALVDTDEFMVLDSANTALKAITRASLVGQLQPSGSVLQSVYAEYVTNSDITTQIALDDSIPQNTEGVEILAAAITPTNSANKLRIRFEGNGSLSAATLVAALFKDSVASAVAATAAYSPTNSSPVSVVLCHEQAAGSTSAQTFKIRVGPSTATTLRMNGSSSARFFGGVSKNTIVIEEIKA